MYIYKYSFMNVKMNYSSELFIYRNINNNVDKIEKKNDLIVELSRNSIEFEFHNL